MKTRTFYILGLAIILISFVLLIEFPESNRMNMIAGALLPIGVGLNAAGYFMLSDRIKATK